MLHAHITGTILLLPTRIPSIHKAGLYRPLPDDTKLTLPLHPKYRYPDLC